MKKIQRIRELVAYLNECRDSYYNKNNSLIPDNEYDKLFDELKILESETCYILANSPTQTVGYETKLNILFRCLVWIKQKMLMS